MAGAGGVLVGRGYVSIRPEFEGDWSRSVNARASNAGKSGAGAFRKSFGVGLKGIGALAGVAIGANLNAAAGAAALLAPALTTAGAAAGALKLGMSGIGDAFKAAFADTSAQASSAASSTRAVEAAQRGLASAQRALADARVQASERIQDALRAVEDAERNLTRTVADAARQQEDAKRRVTDAVRELAESQEEAREVQASLTEARRDAAREIEDLNNKLANSRLEEREAVVAMADAEKALRAAQAKPGNRPEDIAKLQLAYDQAAQAVENQRLETKQLSEDAARANSAGVEGSDKVRAAQERIADAQREVEDRTRALARAREEQRRTEVDSAQEIADAQRALGEAQRGVDEARRDGARQIADAQRAVADAAAAVADAQAAAAGQASQFDQAMSKLAPNAQSFVRAVQGLAPAWRDMKLSVQNALFEDLDSTVTTLGNATIPVLKRGLTETAGVWNQMAKNAAGAITEMAKTGLLDKVLDGATANLKAFEKAPAQIITALGQLSVAAQPAFHALSQQMAGALTSFTDGIAKSFASGGLEQAISSAFGIISQFGTLLGNVLGTVGQIFKAASDAGGEIVGSLAAVFGELRTVLATDEMQASMRGLFTSISQIVSAIVPVLGAVVQAAVPLLEAIAAPIAQLATVLGPVLVQLATTLGAALQPIIEALGPVLVTVGAAIVQLVQAVTPLLQPIADLISGVITALAPALTPIVNVITQLVGVLIGPLTTIVEALTPALTQIGQIIAQVFQALEPMLAPLVTLIGQVAALIADTFAQALQQLMPILTPLIDTGMQLVEQLFQALQPLLPVIRDAIGALGEALLQMLPAFGEIAAAAGSFVEGLAPLIPVGVQLITEVIDALTPVLPVLADAFVGIAKAVLTLVEPLGGLIASVAQQLAPVFADLAPILGEVIGMLAGLLAEALPPLTDALVILVEALVPILPLFGDLVGMVLQMGVGLIMDLLPAILQLVQAAIDLTVALLPLVPPLVQLVGLVVELAVKVLSWLLPPLLQFAGFLVGMLAGALSTVIGWVSGLVGGIASLVSWVTSKLGPAFRWLKDKVVIPVWNGIRAAISAAWSAIKTWVLFPIRDFFTKTIPSWSGTLRSKVTGAWSGLQSGVSTVWSRIKSWVLYPIRDFFTKTIPSWAGTLKSKIVTAFDEARAGIKRVWDKIKGIAKDPVSFIVDTVYNRGLRKVWNLVTDAFGGKHLEWMKFAKGGVYDYGVLPGYTPGRDTHTFVSPTGGLLGLSGGESIFRPEFTRAVGTGFVTYWNDLARSRGVSGVRQAMAATMGGGQTQAFKDGGIFSGIGNALGGAWDKAKKAGSWLTDTFGSAIKAGVKKVINPLIDKIPGGKIGWVGLLKDFAKGAVKRLIAGGDEGDKKGGGKGGKPVDAAIGTRFGVPGRMWSSGFHTGVDFPAPTGTPVRSVLGGSITSATSGGPYGNHIRMSHAGGLTTLYAHLSSMGVKTGQRVGKGTRIGAVGSTGNSTGPHLHLEARRNGKLFDPTTLFDDGGWMPPGSLGYNGLSTPEAVFTPSQFRAFEGAANVGLAAAAGGGASTQYVINARTADFTVADLDRVTRVQEARARVGRPR
ncbi:hypothetical protein EF913_28195 [Streptomyces sp. WAC04189]|uniref:peptidoglycan DD-metalloendopeptidase family protein n=1 Tax=Streptomyces sp. WAC04189 TaxID=2487411 RepID=UPI000FA28D8E|nr:peptidoglycan DD-metalloendopeptidase family protein [Streptomyces sp. WAC04189]RSR98013.1 hypothetical protein EF913_28195 [Streptomyces sp. WAC04189]